MIGIDIIVVFRKFVDYNAGHTQVASCSGLGNIEWYCTDHRDLHLSGGANISGSQLAHNREVP